MNLLLIPCPLTVTIAPTSAYIGQEHTATPIVTGGKIPEGGYVFTYQWLIADDFSGTNESILSGQTSSTFTPTSSQEDKYLGCRCTTIDFFGTSASDTSYIGPVSLLAAAPVIDSILLTEVVDEQNRYTNKEFPFVTTMDEEGEPNPSFKAKVKLSGTTFQFNVLSDVITDIEPGGIKTCETDTIESANGFIASGTWSKVSGADSNTPDEPVAGFNNIWNDNPISKAYFNYSNTASASSRYKFTFDTPILFTKLEAYVGAYDGSPTAWVSFNGGTAIRGGNTTGTPVITDFTDNANAAPGATTGVLTSFEIGTNSANYGYIGQILIDGVPLTTDLITLTFPSSNGFGCFEPGDVVGGQDFRNSYTLDTNDDPGPEKVGRAFDGDLTTRSSMPVRTTCTVTFPVPIVNVSSIRVYLFNATYAESKYFKINGVEKGSDITQLTGWNTITSPPATFSSITYGTSADVSTNIAIAAIEVNGRLLLDGNKVISKDEDANTITVDGGNWDTSNQSQAWSANATGAIDPAPNAFDGKLDTWASGAPLEVPFPSPITVSSLQVYADGVQDSIKVVLDGVETTVSWSGSVSKQWWDVPIVGSAVFSKIISTNGSSAIYAVKADSKLLVDPVNDSQVWSSTPFFTDNGYAADTNRPITKVFNGIVPTSDGDECGSPVSGGTWNLDFGSTFSSATSWKLVVVANTTGANELIINGTPETINVATPTEVTGTGALNTIQWGFTGGNSYCKLMAVYVDGVLLVDKGARDLGDTKLVKETPYDSKLTVASSENLELLTGDVFMTDSSETPAAQTPYKLVTTDIESVDDEVAAVPWDPSEGLITKPKTNITAWCNSNNITAVTGFKFIVSSDSYSTELREFSVNGTTLSASNQTLLTDTGNWFAQLTPTNYLAGTSGIVQAEGSEGDVAQFTFDAFDVTTGTVIAEFVATRSNIYLLDQNGNEHLIFGNTPNQTLTFPGDVNTNPDLRYFKKGDVIQQTASLTMWRNQARQWDAGSKTGTKYRLDTSLLDSTGTTPMNFQEWLGAELNPADDIIDHYVFDDLNGAGENRASTNISPGYEDYSASEWFDRICKSASGDIKPYMGISYQSANNPGSDGDDLEIVGIAPVSVISTGYPDSNTMVVDGGEWGGEGTISYNSANGSNAIDPNNIFDGNENTFGTFTVDGSFIGFDSTGNNLRVKFILDKLHPDHKIYVQPKVNGGWTNSGTFDYNGLNYIDFDGVAAGTEIDTVFTMPDGYDGEARLSATGGNTLKDSTRISIYSSYSAGDTHVEYQTNGGQGSVIEVNTTDNTLLVTNSGSSSNRWIIGATDTDGNAGNSGETGNAANAKNFYVAPPGGAPIEETKAWGVTRISNNKLEVTGIQKNEPTWTAATDIGSKDYTVKFPATFGTGNAPDTDLPDGTAISVWVQAKNSEGEDAKESNVLTPADVNPANSAGPITDSTETTIEVDSSANLDTFSAGADLVMIDDTGSVSNYTMQTSEIESVATKPQGFGYKLYTSTASMINVQSDADLTKIPTPQSGTFRQDVLPGNYPTYSSQVSYSIYEFNTPSKISVIRKGSSITSKPFLAWSDDGENWITGIYAKDGGIGPNNPIESNEYHLYYIFWFTSGHTPSNFAPDPNYEDPDVTLNFADPNPDLKFFRPGDVVQGLAVAPGDKYEHKCDLTGSGQGDPDVLRAYNDPALTKVGDIDFGTTPSQSFTSFVFYYDLGVACKNIHVVRYAGAWPGNNTGPTFTLMGSNDPNSTTWTQLVTGLSVDDGSNPSITQYISGLTPYRYLAFVHNNAPGGIITNRYGIEDNIFDNNNPPVKVISTDLVNNTMVVDGGDWDTSNQSQVWSDGSGYTGTGDINESSYSTLTGGGFTGKTGDLGTNGVGTDDLFGCNNGTATWTGSVSYTKSVAMWCYTNPDASWKFTIDGTVYDVTSQVPVAGGGNPGLKTTFTGLPASGTITKFEIVASNTSKGKGFTGWYLDGKLLVDAVNDSQVWSSVVTVSDQDAALPLTNSFDGRTNTLGAASIGNDYELNFGSLFSTTPAKLEVWSTNGANVGFEIEVDGVSKGSAVNDWVDCGTLTFTTITTKESGGGGCVNAIRVDGKILVDKGLRDLGDSEVTYGPVTGTAKFASTNNTDTLTVTDSNDRWIDNTNRLGTEFYVKDKLQRGLNADSATDRSKFQAIEDAFDGFAANVANRSAYLASIFARLVEGQSVSEAEVSVLTTAIQDEINIQEPFALDGYYPLYITAAKAEAASDQNSYHTHTIEGDTYYMPDGGTIYHGTYVD